MENNHIFYRIRSCHVIDWRVFGVASWIAVGCHDHDHCRSRVPLKRRHRAKAALCCEYQGLEQIRFHSHHDCLTFWVAKSDIVLQDLDFTVLDHEASEQNSLERFAFSFHPLHRGYHHLVHDLLFHFGSQNGSWGVSSHAASVWSFITIIDLLVVLRTSDRNRSFSVTESEVRSFLSLKQLFDDDLVSRILEDLRHHDFIDCLEGFFLCVAKNHSFSCTKSAGFHDNRSSLLLDVRLGFIGRCGPDV
mmetsp:Transcript_13319/g.30660  ORF Transcript_13319/g.30660 Transcript_13319/m.30660 type:complete len:247 (-) Transcript_13319:387-1127(-)